MIMEVNCGLNIRKLNIKGFIAVKLKIWSVNSEITKYRTLWCFLKGV